MIKVTKDQKEFRDAMVAFASATFRNARRELMQSHEWIDEASAKVVDEIFQVLKDNAEFHKSKK